ncbi:MAG: acyl-ACP--UDP-N-acetylglucosamine O-acyltransferase [Bdellovibrionales bacterium]|nr:acyl-ACP--UDP-N-acetylglucosamine O-acyltransferase [Bdellovibrionales bacterium]
MSIHKTAIIDKGVELDVNVEVGPYAEIRGDTQIGKNTIIESKAIVGSRNAKVVIGQGNFIGHSAVIGGFPQDKKFGGEYSELFIGDNNQIREFSSVHVGTSHGGGRTNVGNDNLLMSYSHVAHDVQIGNDVILGSVSQCAGHVVLEDKVTVSGMVGLSQHIRLGKFSYIGGHSAVNKDVLPFTIAEGSWAVMRATNKIGLQRSGFSAEEIEMINRATRFITKGGRTLKEAIELIQTECGSSEHIKYILDFINESERGLAR